MGEAFLDYKKGGSVGLDINGIIQDYYVYAGENVNAGDFVEFVNGVASSKTETSSDTLISNFGKCPTSACKLTENKVFIASGSNSDLTASNNYLRGVVCVIEGTTITTGDVLAISNSTYTGTEVSVVALSETSVFIAHSYGSSYYLYGIVCTIDGTTITKGTDTSLLTTANTGSKISTELLKNGNVFIAHSYGTNKYLYAIVCTISGTTITKGTDIALSNSKYAGYTISTTLLLNGDVFVALSYDSSNYYMRGTVCTVSGTTITAGSVYALSNNANAGKVISALTLPNGNVFIAHSYGSSYYLYGLICTVTETSIGAGTDTAISTVIDSGTIISISLLSDGSIFVLHSYSSSFYLFGVKCIVSDATITVGTDTMLSNYLYAGYKLFSILLENENIFIGHCRGESDVGLYGLIIDIDETNNIPTTEITTTTYETQVKKATTLPCNGVASTSGEGGDETGHKDIVSIYTVNLNLLVNANFSNGLEGWTLISASDSAITISVTDNTVYFNVGETTESGWLELQQTLTLINGHKYYASAMGYYTLNSSNQGTTSKLDLTETSPLGQNITRGSTPNTWEKLSNIIENNSTTTCLFRLGCFKTYHNVSFAYKDAKLYDLTAMFGEGNEPTQEWCDANL